MGKDDLFIDRTINALVVIFVLGIVLCFLLTGCDQFCKDKPPLPPTIVEVPVTVKCIDKAPDKVLASAEADLIKLSDYERTAQVLVEWNNLQAYTKKLEAAIAGCL